MIMQVTGIMAVITAAFLALILVAPKRGAARLPWSERCCLAILKLSAWLDHVGTAYDGAILTYRIEKRMAYIEMRSTREREGRAA